MVLNVSILTTVGDPLTPQLRVRTGTALMVTAVPALNRRARHGVKYIVNKIVII